MTRPPIRRWSTNNLPKVWLSSCRNPFALYRPRAILARVDPIQTLHLPATVQGLDLIEAAMVVVVCDYYDDDDAARDYHQFVNDYYCHLTS
jgi:hypothetical protein